MRLVVEEGYTFKAAAVGVAASMSGFYAATGREPSECARTHDRIKAAVAQVHTQSQASFNVTPLLLLNMRRRP